MRLFPECPWQIMRGDLEVAHLVRGVAAFSCGARFFSGHQTERFAHSRDGITYVADYTPQFARTDAKPVRPVIGLPGA